MTTRVEEAAVDWTLEVVVVPVTDVDRAKEFYADRLGFVVDRDLDESSLGERGPGEPGTGRRLIQLTPPGSGCSIVMGTGLGGEPGSVKGLQLVVADIQAARAELLERGLDVGEVQVLGENPYPMPDPLDNVGFLFFDDPDGNAWAVQQISSRGR